MNCHDYDAFAVDLARDHLVDAAQREEALAHSASCARCALRLAVERALTSGLRSAAKAANEEAPVRVEAVLLTAFRQQHTSLTTVPSVNRFGKRWYYAAASIAAIALIVALFALRVTRTRETQPRAPQESVNAAPIVPEQAPPSIPQHHASPGAVKEVAAVQSPGERRQQPKRIKGGSRPNRLSDDLNAATPEIATDFIPLMNRETLAEMDGGQVMRVELPRSALMSFGLPMDMERATERIKADVVVGNDGLARAIRFVR